MNVLYTEMVDTVLSGHKSGAWVEDKFVTLQSEIWKLNSVVENSFACHCFSESFPQRCKLLSLALGSLKRFRKLFGYGR